MPTYEYHCEANGRSVQVFHPMSVMLTTWGEVCERAEEPIENAEATPAEAPVKRALSTGFVLAKPGSDDGGHQHGGGCCCGVNGCG